MLPYFIRFRTKQYEKDGFPNGSIAYIDVKDNYPIHLRRMELDGLKKAERLLW